MNYINNTDFLNLLKSCAVKINSRSNISFPLLNSLDYAILQSENHFINGNYYEYLVKNRRDILQLPYPILHLLDYCFEEPELIDSYFEKIEPLALRKVRQEFRFFGITDSQKISKMPKHFPVETLSPHKETRGYVLNPHLSNFFSKELQYIDLLKSKEVILDLVEILMKFNPELNSFIRIGLDSTNIDFFANFETLNVLSSFQTLICFDFSEIHFLEDKEDLNCLKIFEYLTDVDINRRPFLILTNSFGWISKLYAQKLLSNNLLCIKSSMSDFYFPSFIPNKEILGELSNSYYGNFKFDGYFYFGENSELYSELDEIYNNIINNMYSTEVATIIYVKELNIAGTEMLSNSFFDFLNSIGSRTILIYEKMGSMHKFMDLSHQNLLCLPLGIIGFQETLDRLFNLGYTNFVSFTSANFEEVKVAEFIGFRTFIYYNETFEFLKSLGVPHEQFFDVSNSNRTIIINSKSDFSVNYENLIEIPTSIPSEFSKLPERKRISYSRQFFGIEGKVVIGTLATGILRKGIDRVQDILDLLPDNVVYLWVGEIDPKFSINSSNFRHVDFMSTADFYSVIDIYSCLSRNDPFPMSVTESLLRGIPVVAYDKESCGQIDCLDFKDIVVSDGDPKSFVDNVTKLKINNNLENHLDFSNEILRRLKYSPQAFNKKSMNIMGLVSPTI